MITPLSVQSAMSLQGIPFLVEDYVKNAVEKGYKIIVLNEWETLTSAITFFKTCQYYNVKPILAMSFLYNGMVVSAVAKNGEGYKELVHLCSIVNTHDTIDLTQYTQLLYLIDNVTHSSVKQLIDDVKENVYVVMNDSNHMQLNESNTLSLPIVVSKTVYYLNSEDKHVYDTLQTMVNKQPLSLPYKQDNGLDYLLQADDYRHYCLTVYNQSYYDNTLQLFQNLSLDITLNQSLLPKVFDKANETLTDLAYKGLAYRHLDTPKYRERLNYELGIMIQMGFADYFLILADIVQFAKKENITLGAGRGSSAASLVLYCLEITNIDPLKYQLLFERFLNPNRFTMPDVDLDLPDNRRYDVINYVKQKYGQSRVAQIGTFQTYGPKGSLRELAKLFQQKKWEIDRWSHAIGNESTIRLDNPTLQQIIAESQTNATIVQLAKHIEKLPKNVSKHAAGIVISNQAINKIVPVYTDETNGLVTQFVMSDIEAVGLVKMDFLGVRHLTVLSQAQDYVRQSHKDFDIWTIDYQDDKTLALFASGETDGVFQFDSQGIRTTLRQIKPSSIEEVAAVCALYRPGPMDQSGHFTKRKFGIEPIEYIHPTLEAILKETYGIIVYQEQIMQIASIMSNFTLGQSDILRRAISKKNMDELLAQKESFINGALNNGYSLEEATSVFDYIEKFADYGFAKSHAFAYAIFAYQMAFIKAHYPQAYYLALLLHTNARSEKYTQYITLAMQQRIAFRVPNINDSQMYASLYDTTTIQLGLSTIKGIRKEVVVAILNERKHKGHYTSFNQFVSRLDTKYVKSEFLEALIKAGCFDSFGDNRATLVNAIESVIVNSQFFSDDISVKIVDVKEYTDDDIMQMETELLGFSFSVNVFNQFMPYYQDGIFMATTNSMAQQQVVFVGKLKQIRKIFTKQNKRMAFAKFEDMHGKIDVVIFPDIFVHYISLIQEDEICVIKGFIEERKGQLQCRVDNMYTVENYLNDYTQRQKIAFIKVPDRLKMKEITPILQQHSGGTPVVIFFENERKYQKISSKFNANFNEVLIEKLKQVVGEESIVIKENKK